ncbi:MAG TPA: helix-turn-helix domain-containing protein [Longimicrobium sp.]|nr:helix-turn-helix domain-containing protein [Longimicrobium sp.]
MDTIEKTQGIRLAEPITPAQEELLREVLERVADKWTLLVLDALEEGGEMRFTRLRDRVGGVSQKMLTKTLRQLERDGLVTRRVYPEVPPRVEYRLTARGHTLNEATCAMWLWVEANADAVQQSRRTYDEAAGVRADDD